MAKMKYEIISDIKLADGYCGGYRNGKPEGVLLHEPANTGLIQNQIAYELRDPENNGIVHAWSSDAEIREILSTDYKCWGAGGVANARFAQIECCRFDNKSRAVASIDRGLFWAAYQLFYYNLPCTDATKTGNGTVWTHLAVSRFLGNTDHTDPIAYWSSVGVSWDAAFAQIKRYYDALHAGDSTVVPALGQTSAAVATPKPVASPTVTFSGQAHIQNKGWVEMANNVLGTVGESLRLEAFSLVVKNKGVVQPMDGVIHVQDIGDVGYQSGTNLFGTVGQEKRLEAVKINVGNGVQYRTHVANQGWGAWVSSGQWSGTKEMGLRIEAIEFRVG
mgnify:CR=1 FL=1